MGKQHLGQMERVLSAHAAMAERTQPIAEEMPVWRIVHVNVVLVWEAEFHNAQHILPPRTLRELVAADVHARPIDRVGIDRVAVDAHAEPPKPLQDFAAPAAAEEEETAASAA